MSYKFNEGDKVSIIRECFVGTIGTIVKRSAGTEVNGYAVRIENEGTYVFLEYELERCDE